jgi:hypothetical protein
VIYSPCQGIVHVDHCVNSAAEKVNGLHTKIPHLVECIAARHTHADGTGVISDEKIAELVHEHFDLRPTGIILMLDLLRPIYEKTTAYGHFGREEPEFSWERTDKAQALRAAAGL